LALSLCGGEKGRSLSKTPQPKPLIWLINTPVISTIKFILPLFSPKNKNSHSHRHMIKKEAFAESSTKTSFSLGAEDGIRTRDPRLGKAMLYP
jgi:hypothetical protein